MNIKTYLKPNCTRNFSKASIKNALMLVIISKTHINAIMSVLRQNHNYAAAVAAVVVDFSTYIFFEIRIGNSKS